MPPLPPLPPIALLSRKVQFVVEFDRHHERANIVNGAAVADVAVGASAAVAALVSPIGAATAAAAAAADGAVVSELATLRIELAAVVNGSTRARPTDEARAPGLPVVWIAGIAGGARDTIGPRGGVCLEKCNPCR